MIPCAWENFLNILSFGRTHPKKLKYTTELMGTTFAKRHFTRQQLSFVVRSQGSVQLLVALSLLSHPRNGVSPMPKARTKDYALSRFFCYSFWVSVLYYLHYQHMGIKQLTTIQWLLYARQSVKHFPDLHLFFIKDYDIGNIFILILQLGKLRFREFHNLLKPPPLTAKIKMLTRSLNRKKSKGSFFTEWIFV